ncbi:probable DNA polymerase [Odontomachus brunneus]|uniref:probable DNA polymerase n=1 Tax=Odontomachus brunneus TaxID=486640 RepID=UPI0013F27BBC|nr:probable DNA polymerase [Odontomachus brunneus]
MSREDTIEARYERTLVTMCRLRKRGYVVTEKWECIFDRELRESRKIREFVENHPMLRNNPLELREAFYGGRMENIVTRYEVTDTEKIRYVDVYSLYQYVLKTDGFPLGHLDIYVGGEYCALIGAGPDFNFDAVEGFVRCRVLAPRDLFHPVLPYRVNEKLLFALCRSCCKTFSQTACTHNDPADREFEGAWVSCELRKAIEKGYRVTSVSEIWSYEIMRYDPVTRRGGLFTDGWPNECANDEGGKERYLREYEKVEGIVLNRVNISPNPGLRSVTKLCLNSFWGKFDQRSNLPNTEIVRTWESFTALLTSSEHGARNNKYVAPRFGALYFTTSSQETRQSMPVLLKRSFNDNGYSVPYGYVSSE